MKNKKFYMRKMNLFWINLNKKFQFKKIIKLPKKVMCNKQIKKSLKEIIFKGHKHGHLLPVCRPINKKRKRKINNKKLKIKNSFEEKIFLWLCFLSKNL